MNACITKDGQLELPDAWRKQDHIAEGEHFEIERLGEGQYLVKRIHKNLKEKSLFEWLMACPEKNWFKELESESTATL